MAETEPAKPEPETKKLETVARNVPEVPPIPTEKLSIPELNDDRRMTPEALTRIKKHLLAQGMLSEGLARHILTCAGQVLAKDPNIVNVVNTSVVIVGDIHGQFYDLVNIVDNVCSKWPPSSSTFVFLGDYVDRGSFGTEVVFYVCALKLLYPRTMCLLRGNHESEKLNRNFNFPHEFASKYSDSLYSAVHKTFNSMPIGAVVSCGSRKYFCAHGGISRKAKDISDINNINRFTDVVQNGVMTDLLWSDPSVQYESKGGGSSFEPNKERGCAHRYSHSAVKKFLKRNHLTCVIRGHEVMHEGYKLYKQNNESFPTLITVFSAPNYVDSYGNQGAVLVIEEDEINVQAFQEVDHPYLLPDQLNAFTWSIPYVAKSISDILLTVLNVCTKEELDGEEDEPAAMTQERKKVVKGKILAVARMGKFYRLLQQENEAILRLKVLSPTGLLPPGALSQGQSGIMEILEKRQSLGFDEVKKLDAENEKMNLDIEQDEDYQDSDEENS